MLINHNPEFTGNTREEFKYTESINTARGVINALIAVCGFYAAVGIGIYFAFNH